ncbi:unnamed protein product [Heterobilharzia americana]|nr:unnamed protein product [Heterobilharzia americana]
MSPSGHIVVIRRDGTDGLTCDWYSRLCDIGSNQSCDIRVQHSTVAPFHCTLQLMENGLVQALSRVDEKYKMLVNGCPLKDACILSDNSTLTVGDRQFRFIYPSIQKIATYESVCAASKLATNQNVNENIFTPDSLPIVYPPKRTASRKLLVSPAANSPRPRSATPKRTLGTRERYGPVPPRQPNTPPVIQVLRHQSSSQSKMQSLSQSKDDRFTRQSVVDGFVSTYAPKSQNKDDHSKSYTTCDLPPLTSSTPGSLLFSSDLKSKQSDRTLISSTPPVNQFNSKVKENKSKYIEKQPEKHKTSFDQPESKSFRNTSAVHHATESPCNRFVRVTKQHSNSLKFMNVKSPVNSLKNKSKTPSKEVGLQSNYLNSDDKSGILDEIYPIDEAPVKKSSTHRINFKRRSLDLAESTEEFPSPRAPPTTPVSVKLTEPTNESNIAQSKENVTKPYLSKRDKLSTPVSAEPLRLSNDSSIESAVSVDQTHVEPSKIKNDFKTKTMREIPNSNHPLYTNKKNEILNSSKANTLDLKKKYSSFSSEIQKLLSTYDLSMRVNQEKQYQTSRILCKRVSLPVTKTSEIQPTVELTGTRQQKSNPNKRRCTSVPSIINPSKPLQKPTPNTPKNTSTLKKTSRTAITHVASIVDDSSVVESSVKRRRGRPSSVPSSGVVLEEDVVATPEKRLSPVLKSVGYSGVRRLMKTPSTTVHTPVVSDVGDSSVVESSVKRRRGRPSSVPSSGVVLEEDVVATPEKRLSPVLKSVGYSGVRRLMKTPSTTVHTPVVSDVGDSSVVESSVKRRRGRPSSVPSSGVVLEEDVVATPEKRLSPVLKSVGYSGVRRLMKTPSTTVHTPVVSDVGDSSVVESSVKRRRGRPSSVPSSGVVLEEDVVATPEKRLSPVLKSVGYSGVRRLMKTPSTTVHTPVVSDVGDSSVVESSVKRRRGRPSSVPSSGVVLEEDVVATPEKRLSPVLKSVGYSGVRRLMKTPSTTVHTPVVSDVGDSSVVESSVKRRRGRPSSVPSSGVVLEEDVVATPEKRLSPVLKSVGYSGVRRLMKTPSTTVHTPVVSDVGDSSVVESSVKRRRGRPSSVPSSGVVLEEDVVATPEKRLSPVLKSVGYSGVRRLMKTPSTTVHTPVVSDVGDSSVVESSVKRRRGRPSSVPSSGVVLEEDVVATPEKRLSPVLKSVGYSGVRRLMKTPSTTVHTPVVSDVGDSSVVESSVKRRRGRPSSVPSSGVVLEEDVVATPEKRLSPVLKSVGYSGVRRLMKTPSTTVHTPVVSDVGDSSVVESSVKRRRGRPSSVPSSGVVLEEDVVATPEKRLSPVLKSVGYSGVRRLMKTPSTTVHTPVVSDVGDSSVVESSVKRRRGRPSSVPSSGVVLEEDVVATPEKRLSPVLKSVGYSGVRRLMKTPSTTVHTPVVSDVGDSSVVESSVKRRRGRPSSVPSSGVVLEEDVVATPEKRLSPVLKSVGYSGVRRLMKTPSTTVHTPVVSDVGDSSVVESSVKRRRGRPSSVPSSGVVLEEDVVATPEKRLSPVLKSVGYSGVRRLMKTPSTTVHTPVVSDVGDSSVVESSVKRRRGRPSSVPSSGVVLEEDVVATPEKRLSPVLKSVGYSGVRRLMKTPSTTVHTPVVSDVGDSSVVESSVKRRRGRPSSVPSSGVVLEEDVVATPEKRLSPVLKSVGYSGVRRLMKTPSTTVHTPVVSDVGDSSVVESSVKRRRGRPSSVPSSGVVLEEDVVATPEKRLSPVLKSVGYSGVRRLMKTPSTTVHTPVVSDVGDSSVVESSVKRRRGRPSSVPSSGVVLEEDVVATPEKRLSPVLKSVGYSGVRRLMKTPSTTVHTPVVSDVGDSSVVESSVKRRRGRPSSVPSSGVVLEEDVVATPEKRLSPVLKSVGYSGVRRLMKTPSTTVHTPVVSDVGDSSVVESSVKRRRGRPSSVPSSGVVLEEDVVATPEKRLSPVLKSVGYSGVRRLMKTPSTTVHTPVVSDVGDSSVVESSVKRRRGRPSSVPSSGVVLEEDVVATPEKRLSPVLKSVGYSGVRRLMKTPSTTVHTPVVSDVGDSSVVESSVKRRRGRPSSVPSSGVVLEEDVVATPEKRLSPVLKSVGYSGVRRLMKTPSTTVHTPVVSDVGDSSVVESSVKRRRGRPSSVPSSGVVLEEDVVATPEKRLSPVLKSVGYSGVRRLMKTPSTTVHTPVVSDVGDSSVVESSVKRRRGRPSSVPSSGVVLEEDVVATPEKRLSPVLKSVGYSGVRRLMKTPSTTVHTPVVSDVGDSSVVESSVKRRRGRPSSVPSSGVVLEEDVVATPEKRLSPVLKSVGYSGVRRLMKTPSTTVHTPVVSDVGDSSVVESSVKRRRGRPSSVPSSGVVLEEDVVATPEKRLSPVLKSVGYSGVRRLMKTPSTTVHTPVVSVVGDSSVVESSVKRRRGRPSSVPSSGVVLEEDVVATPEKRLSPVLKSVGYSGVRRLMKTPSTTVHTPVVSDVGDSSVVESSVKRRRGRPSSVPSSGVVLEEDVVATPEKRLSPVLKSVGYSGVRRLMKTPSTTVHTPVVSDVGDSSVVESSVKRRRGPRASVSSRDEVSSEVVKKLRGGLRSRLKNGCGIGLVLGKMSTAVSNYGTDSVVVSSVSERVRRRPSARVRFRPSVVASSVASKLVPCDVVVVRDGDDRKPLVKMTALKSISGDDSVSVGRLLRSRKGVVVVNSTAGIRVRNSKLSKNGDDVLSPVSSFVSVPVPVVSADVSSVDGMLLGRPLRSRKGTRKSALESMFQNSNPDLVSDSSKVVSKGVRGRIRRSNVQISLESLPKQNSFLPTETRTGGLHCSRSTLKRKKLGGNIDESGSVDAGVVGFDSTELVKSAKKSDIPKFTESVSKRQMSLRVRPSKVELSKKKNTSKDTLVPAANISQHATVINQETSSITLGSRSLNSVAPMKDSHRVRDVKCKANRNKRPLVKFDDDDDLPKKRVLRSREVICTLQKADLSNEATILGSGTECSKSKRGKRKCETTSNTPVLMNKRPKKSVKSQKSPTPIRLTRSKMTTR